MSVTNVHTAKRFSCFLPLFLFFFFSLQHKLAPNLLWLLPQQLIGPLCHRGDADWFSVLGGCDVSMNSGAKASGGSLNSVIFFGGIKISREMRNLTRSAFKSSIHLQENRSLESEFKELI